MKFNLISRLVLALLVFSGIGQLAGAKETVTKTANISLEGTLPPNCSVKINGGKEFLLKMASPATKSETIELVSSCNRTSTHTLEISYDHPNAGSSSKGELWRAEQGSADSKPILYGVKTAKGEVLSPENPLKSQGRDIKESVQVDFETDNRSAGTYYGAVTLTLKDV